MLSKNLFSRFFMLIGIIAIASVLLASGQTGKFEYQGKVIDQNRAAIAGAKVTATAKKRANIYTAVTDQNGEFSLSIEPGEYDLRAIANGFSESSQNVSLAQGNTSAAEIVLQVAGANAIVTVSDTATYKTDAVVSATKTITPLRDVPQTVSVVSKEQIRDQAMQSIGDALRYTPGIAVHQGENNRDQAIIRGQSTSADFFLNGVRDDVQYYRDPYNLERLETLKGTQRDDLRTRRWRRCNQSCDQRSQFRFTARNHLNRRFVLQPENYRRHESGF